MQRHTALGEQEGGQHDWGTAKGGSGGVQLGLWVVESDRNQGEVKETDGVLGRADHVGPLKRLQFGL